MCVGGVTFQVGVRKSKKLLRDILLVLKHSLSRCLFFLSLGTTPCFIRRVQSRHTRLLDFMMFGLSLARYLNCQLMSGLMMFTTLEYSLRSHVLNITIPRQYDKRHVSDVSFKSSAMARVPR
jgi:hypothetical protein